MSEADGHDSDIEVVAEFINEQPPPVYMEVVAEFINVQPPQVNMEVQVIGPANHESFEDEQDLLLEWANDENDGAAARKVVDLEASSDSERDYDSDEKVDEGDSDLEALIDHRSDSEISVSGKKDFLEILEARLERRLRRKKKRSMKKNKSQCNRNCCKRGGRNGGGSGGRNGGGGGHASLGRAF